MSSMQYSVSNIPLHNIHIDDSLIFRLYPPDDRELRESIREIGLIDPLWVYPQADQSYLILGGARRLDILREAACKQAPCRVLQSEALIDAFIYYVKVRISSGQLSYVEKHKIVEILQRYFELARSDITDRYRRVLGFVRKNDFWEIASVLAEFTENDKLFLHRYGFAEQEVFLLRKLCFKDREALLLFLDRLHFSHSNVRQLMELVTEVAQMRRETVQTIIETAGIDQIPSDEDMPAQKKLLTIRNRLVQLRYPLIQEYQQRMKEAMAKLGFPAGVQLTYPVELEDESVTLLLRFSSYEELKCQLDGMAAGDNAEVLQQLFEVMRSYFSKNRG